MDRCQGNEYGNGTSENSHAAMPLSKINSMGDQFACRRFHQLILLAAHQFHGPQPLHLDHLFLKKVPDYQSGGLSLVVVTTQ